MLKFLKRNRRKASDGSNPLAIRDLMEYRELQAVMGPIDGFDMAAFDAPAPLRLVFRRAGSRSLFPDTRLLDRAS